MYYITRYMFWRAHWLGISFNTCIYFDIGCLPISSHCGVAIYLNNEFSYERKFIDNTSAVFESMAIEIWKNDTITISRKYLLSSVYWPPSVLVETLTSFTGDFSSNLDDVQKG